MLKLRVNLDDEEVLDGKGSVKVICYGKEEVWESREEALNFYLKAIAGSEGSEKERYSNIFLELCAGLKVCTDTVEKEE